MRTAGLRVAFWLLTCLVTFLHIGLASGLPKLLGQSGKDLTIAADAAFSLTNGDFDQVNEYVHQCQKSEDLNSCVQQLMQLTYGGNISSFGNVLKFIRHTENREVQLTGFKTLRHEMKIYHHEHTNEMMLLIFHIKQVMSDKSISKDLLTEYETLKASLPANMRAIIFGEEVTIKNSYYNEYLYVSSYYVNNQRLMFTWVPGEIVNQAMFYLHVFSDGDKLYYHILNDRYEQGAPMCPSSSNYDHDRRKTVTCPNGPNDGIRWFVNPTENGLFTIRNKVDSKFIYAPNDGFKYDRDRRYLFTWLGDPEDQSEYDNWHWAIDPL